MPPSAPSPQTRLVRTGDGIDIAVSEFPGEGPPLLLLHATGFCGAVLAPIATHLASHFRCVAVDLRGHGHSGAPADGEGPLAASGDDGYSWETLAQDVLAVVDALGVDQPYGWGHSCGGATLVLAEEARPGTFAGLCLYEPVIFPAPPSAPSIAGNRLAEGALRRRETFPSRAAALAHFSTRPPLCALDPDVLTAYVEQGFRDLPDGSVGLACERRHEALVYAHGLSHHGFADLEKVRCRVVVTYGEHTDSFGPSLLRPTVERLPNACLHELSGLGHFGPLENPTVVADSILATFTPSAPSTRPGSNTAAP